jgi:hypothetical protein
MALLLQGSTLKIFFSKLDVNTRGTRSEIKINIFLDGVGCPIFSNWAQWHLASKMLTMLNQDEKCQNLISGWFSFSMYFHPKLEFWGVVIANNRCEVKD